MRLNLTNPNKDMDFLDFLDFDFNADEEEPIAFIEWWEELIEDDDDYYDDDPGLFV